MRGRPAAAAYLGVLDLQVGRGQRQEVQGRHERGGVGLHLAGHLDLAGGHGVAPRRGAAGCGLCAGRRALACL